ncbi:DUF4192 domain-containing protein [Streptomyces sp. NPDC001714]|uniref:DUF4192 domain-containing protein n=1 Tax=Streptomyces sp. NPDC001714 TaxID=3364603 RepID=UPI0036924071
MTNHSETTGPSENDDIARGAVPLGPSAHDTQVTQVTLRTPAELADALPYLLGYRPEDSMVLVALHDRVGRGRFGGRARLGIPANKDDWESAARQLAQGLVTGGERRGARPEQMVAYVCQEPARGESGRDVMHRLAPLTQLLRIECGRLDVPVIEALCVSDGRFWSYCCPTEECCPPEGAPMGLPGTSVLAAAATYAGIQVRGSLRELRARLLPWETGPVLEQEIALDSAGMALVPRILDDAFRADVAEETLALAERLIVRYAAATPVSGTHQADARDDALLSHDEAATLILGLQDRVTRDRAAAWMEGDEAGPALRLWRALARRCVGPYGEHAAAPLTLAGWVAWSAGDDLEAREAFAMALGADPDYLFAKLLHQACNEGLDPESIRRCLRTERTERTDRTERTELADRTERTELGDRTDRVPADGTAAVGDAGPPHRDVDDSSAAASGTRRGRHPRTGDTADDRRPRPAGTRPRQVRSGHTRPGAGRPAGTRTRAVEKVERSGTGGSRADQEGGRSGRGRNEGDE